MKDSDLGVWTKYSKRRKTVDKDRLKELLKDVRDKKIDIDEALISLKHLPYEDLGYAHIDKHRALRTGYPEVIFCQNKAIDHIKGIVERLKDAHSSILATRATPEVYEALKEVRDDITYFEKANIVLIGETNPIKGDKSILIITAGTSDIPVAEEAAVTATALGNKVDRLFDIGVAGIHRVFGNIEKLYDASVIIVIAGMDGALPSIIGGLVDVPVIAVPTSVGYGASFDGLAALLTMMNSCASGVAVVNIDNGFGAGYFASIVNQKGE